MKYNKTLALVPAILLAACGGEEQTMKEDRASGSVVYSYPSDGQTGISPKSDIVIRFSHAITDEEAAIRNKILIQTTSGNVDFTVTKVDGGRSLKLEPAGELTTGTEYSISFAESLMAADANPIGTPNAQGPDGIQFITRAGFTGIAGEDNLSGTFEVAEMIPSPEGDLQPMDFSSFRFLLTQPVHPKWREMGGAVTLEDSDGNAVPAKVLVDQRRITVDPCLTDEPAQCGTKADELVAGATYTLRISGLPSLTSPGTTLDFEKSFTVRETGPTVVLFQKVIDSGLLAGTEPRTSKLNGQIINGVTLNSVLQGTAGPSQQTGGLFAELAYAPAFEADEPLPLRVPRNSVLNSSSLDVKINGTVPIINPETGVIQQTGNIKVTMISDASGYLLPNPYTDDLSAPRHVKLFMDVAMNTEEAQPNASLSQDLLGVELSGIALVEDGVLTIDAIGVVEPNLLGQEFTDSTIAFRIEAATDADSALDAEGLWEPDSTGPTLVSWMPGPDDAIPGNRDQMQRPGDPIVLNFDEPLDEASLDSAFILYAGNANTVPVQTRLDGTTVAINPQGGLQHGVDYTLAISTSLTDLAGNSAASQSLNFALPPIKDGTEAPFASPIALTTYPGFPCVTENMDIANGQHGTCTDSAPSGTIRDEIPVMSMPRDRPIVVKFSQSMDLDTINGQSFVVEKLADPASPGSVGAEEQVTGRIEKSNQQIRFYPEQAWEIGATYRYTMRSAVDGDCGSGAIICSQAGLALQTDLLVDPSDIGGPDLSIYFTGSSAVGSVFTPLRNLPIRDTNSNYVVDCGSLGSTDCLEPFDHIGENENFLPSANSSKLTIVDGQSSQGPARVGCSPDGADCPKNKFIYQTYGLDTEVIGPATSENGETIGVRVLLYPTLLATTSARVIVSANLLLGSDITSDTGTQILRMTYGQPTEDNPLGLVEGVIVEGADGSPVFKTRADLTLDAPNLSGVTSHDVYSKPLTLELEGPITFFDDGRMQIAQRNLIAEDITVNAVSFGLVPVEIPLRIPSGGTYLNFISNPIKEIPVKE